MKPRLVVLDDLDIRPAKSSDIWGVRKPGRIALHCANISASPPPRTRRLVPRLYIGMAALPVFALGAILFAGAMAKALRWATFQ